MTDSNLAGQPVDPVTGAGTDVTFTTDNGDIITGVDPAYAHAYPPAGDGSVFTVPDLPPASHAPHPELVEKLDHALEHLHTLTQKVDHLLEHIHQPLTGTINIDCPPKTPAGITGDVTTLG